MTPSNVVRLGVGLSPEDGGSSPTTTYNDCSPLHSPRHSHNNPGSTFTPFPLLHCTLPLEAPLSLLLYSPLLPSPSCSTSAPPSLHPLWSSSPFLGPFGRMRIPISTQTAGGRSPPCPTAAVCSWVVSALSVAYFLRPPRLSWSRFYLPFILIATFTSGARRGGSSGSSQSLFGALFRRSPFRRLVALSLAVFSPSLALYSSFAPSSAPSGSLHHSPPPFAPSASVSLSLFDDVSWGPPCS